ncbi:MAG: hypothetical protein J5794_00395 [Lachnospiraceae bacterium]|nr:hypothetical protein [Lachnospiraceae bacterium]
MQYYSELLAFFAEDGDQTAEDALWDKYAELLRKLKKHRGNSWSKNDTVFCFSLICLALSRDNAAYCKIAQDIGNLFLSGQCDVDDFEWLYKSRPRGMNAFLKRKAPSSEELSAFLTAFDDLERERASSAADQQERLFAADQQKRLFAEDSPADDPESVLFKTIENYQPEDESFLRNALLGLQIDYAERTHWHGLHMEVLDLFDSKSGVRKPPKTLLPIIYESTLCSCCREYALYYMGKHRMISDPMWEEMLYDSNEDIRTMARQHFRRLEKRRS